ncbi:MAG: Phosphate import ATP-binding protein PstB 3 [Syntrophaceae bacterium PtaB.Bin038]|jgi:phosphate transport system ATP-binding protein|nr:MAG: Phosphate import ATP-binding protein PstB 3 [Syntrophaceae bacterium PtaB.Bin038]
MNDEQVKIKVTGLDFFYRDRRILTNLNVRFERNAITALVGPSGTGKSTFLYTLNRLWENIPDARMSGTVEMSLGGLWRDIYEGSYPVTELRRRVGLVFQTPNPLPMSIRKNVAFPLKLAGNRDRRLLQDRIEQALQMAYLWDEVKDRLDDDARTLSGGQQQRLCIARALVLEPEVLLMDEPTSSLDAAATEIIETLLVALKQRFTVLVVSHYLDQVRRVADCVVTFPDGAVVSNSSETR